MLLALSTVRVAVECRFDAIDPDCSRLVQDQQILTLNIATMTEQPKVAALLLEHGL